MLGKRNLVSNHCYQFASKFRRGKALADLCNCLVAVEELLSMLPSDKIILSNLHAELELELELYQLLSVQHLSPCPLLHFLRTISPFDLQSCIHTRFGRYDHNYLVRVANIFRYKHGYTSKSGAYNINSSITISYISRAREHAYPHPQYTSSSWLRDIICCRRHGRVVPSPNNGGLRYRRTTLSYLHS